MDHFRERVLTLLKSSYIISILPVHKILAVSVVFPLSICALYPMFCRHSDLLRFSLFITSEANSLCE